MTHVESLAAWLLVPVLLACLWRARLLVLAILPPLALSAVQWLDLVDTSSAYHPLRWLVPIVSLSAAMSAAYIEMRKPRASRAVLWAARAPIRKFGLRWQLYRAKFYDVRALVASVLIFASGCADIPALLAWGLPGEWVLVPLQIAVCLVVAGVLLAPERWFHGR